MRRLRLAKRMIRHRARKQTIQDFTALSRHQQETLRHRWGIPTEARQRGPSPSSLAHLLRTERSFEVATIAALVNEILGLITATTQLSPDSTSLEVGEHLCYVHEAIEATFPHLNLQFEQLLLLIRGFGEADLLRIAPCRQCGAAVLVDKLAARLPTCMRGCPTQLPSRLGPEFRANR